MNLELLLLTIYILGFLGFGIWCSRYIKTMDDFALAGRSLTLPVLLGTLFASNVGGGTVVGWTGSFFSFGIDWWFTAAGALLALLAATFILAEKTRKLEQYTIPDLLAIRYDDRTRITGSFMIILGDIALTCIQIMSLGGILSAYFGVEPTIAKISGALIFMAIAFFGGMVGVAFTDALQAIFIGVGLIFGAVFAVNHAGGWSNMVAALPDSYFTPFSQVSPIQALSQAIAVFGTVAVWQSIIFSRTFAAKDAKTAKRGILFLIPASFIGYLAVSIMGYAARSIFGNTIAPGEVFASLVNEVFPTALGFVLLALVVSAILTTSNSILLSLSINITRDFYQKLFNKNATDRDLLKVGKFSVLIVGLLSLAMALFMPNIVSAIVFTYTMYSAALLIPVYGGFLWKRATATGGFLGLISGGATAWIWYLLGQPGVPAMIPALIVSFICFIVGSLATEKPNEEQLKVFKI